ncbi:MAG: uncharacterized protein QG603_244 [Patescibacteria group bacterium]|nr:uncharacterized protein [Patescibacteria group bacterium]
MSIIKQIDQDLITAQKAKDEVVVLTLRMVKSAFKNQAIELRKPELLEAEAILILRRELKKRVDSIQAFNTGGRPELAAQEQVECEIIKKYLPAELSENDVIKAIDEVLATGTNNFGQVMKEVMQKLQGQADGQLVQRLVKEKLVQK